jgi:hypothetical protein
MVDEPASVPTGSGLGIDLDMQRIASLRIDRKAAAVSELDQRLS